MNAFWNDKIVLVMGAHGFLGSHLVRALQERDAMVFSLDRWVNVRVQSEVEKALMDYQPNLVFHVAGRVGGIGFNAAHPAQLIYDNAMMNLSVFDSVAHYGRAKLVTVGSICAYPKYCPVPFDESRIWDGYPDESNAPYGVAKRLALTLSQSYRQEHGLNSIVLLPANLYGPGDHFEDDRSHVIPALIKKFIEGKPPVTVWGSGQATREFLYVEDCVRGLLLAAESYDRSEPLNLGSGHELSIAKLAVLIADLCAYTGDIDFDATKPDGQPRRWISSARARDALQWKARIPIEVGLARTIAWYRGQRT